MNRGKTVSKAVDENMKTWWSAKTGDVGEYLQIDLGRLYGVWSVQVNFADQDTENNPNSRNGDFSYKYLLEFSQDGETWHTLVDRTQNDSDTSHDYYEFAKMVGMRYVRVTAAMCPKTANLPLAACGCSARAPEPSRSRCRISPWSDMRKTSARSA